MPAESTRGGTLSACPPYTRIQMYCMVRGLECKRLCCCVAACPRRLSLSRQIVNVGQEVLRNGGQRHTCPLL